MIVLLFSGDPWSWQAWLHEGLGQQVIQKTTFEIGDNSEEDEGEKEKKVKAWSITTGLEPLSVFFPISLSSLKEWCCFRWLLSSPFVLLISLKRSICLVQYWRSSLQEKGIMAGGSAEQNRRARVSGAERDDGQAGWSDQWKVIIAIFSTWQWWQIDKAIYHPSFVNKPKKWRNEEEHKTNSRGRSAMKIEIRKTSNKLSCQIFYIKMVSNQIHLWLYSTGDKHLSKFHQELWFPKSHNHVQYFPRVSWPAFTEMPMWPLSPLSGLPLISVMAPFMLYNVHSTLSVI